MDTPVCDFVSDYAASSAARFHMPGHKGRPMLGPEPLDITEIYDADDLFRPSGIIRQSEENAARLFGSGCTLYSTEGSSLCIRAMLLMAVWRAREKGLPLRLLAGRNAHRTLMSAAAFLNLEVEWLHSARNQGLLQCGITPEALERRLAEQPYMAVYLTSPDYLGHLAPVKELARVCRRFDVPLLVDNAHGAYLKFLPEDQHPLSLGADLVCDSAHKTLPCLTGAAYLHIRKGACRIWQSRAKEAMALFGSTSPSWLILQSLDRVNAELAGPFPARLAETVKRLNALKGLLAENGWKWAGEEPMKLTLAPKSRGYTGLALAEILRAENLECEFADPDFVTLMPSPDTSEEDWRRLEKVLLSIPLKDPLPETLPDPGIPERVCSLREALLSPAVRVSPEEAEGRILADPEVSCPPAVPIRLPGERLDAAALACFRYYGHGKNGLLVQSDPIPGGK